MDPRWVGTHELQIQSRNGVLTPDSERGENGLFGKINSEIITIQVVNPCSKAIVNSDNELVLADLVAPDGVNSFESELYNKPSNSVELGSGV